MASRLIRFLAQIGGNPAEYLKNPTGAMDEAGLSEREREVLSSGDADRIQAFLASAAEDDDRGVTQRGLPQRT